MALTTAIFGMRIWPAYMMSGLAVIGLGLGIMTVNNFHTVSTMQATAKEADLSKIGNGRPAIVQIHDPQCSLCQTLQDQTRDILSAFEAEKFEYLVANIKTQKGSRFAVRYGVPHVTLLLFDAKGKMIQSIRGPIRTAILTSIIADHMRRHG